MGIEKARSEKEFKSSDQSKGFQSKGFQSTVFKRIFNQDLDAIIVWQVTHQLNIFVLWHSALSGRPCSNYVSQQLSQIALIFSLGSLFTRVQKEDNVQG